MNILKMLCGFACLVVLAGAIWSMSQWNEARGVYDDVCYLRQAHLFKRFGLGGLNTDITRDDDGFLASKLKEIDFPGWDDPAKAPCHVRIQSTGKTVMQYPPGTGFMLALFPEGSQVIPLYVLSAIIVFGFALLAISYARPVWLILFSGAVGCAAIYLMVNPAKASYSMPPTLMACIAAAYLTARLFGRSQPRHETSLTILLGLLLGLAVNFRLPNLFLSFGYFLFFVISFLSSRQLKVFVQGALFSIAYLVGLAPTLLTNAINAGSSFATTYGGHDVTAPDLDVSVIWLYFTDLQSALLLFVVVSIVFHATLGRTSGIRRVLLLVTANVLVNFAFFLSHPVFTSYYTVPIATLASWSLLFNWLMQPAETVEQGLLEQAAKA